jgi:hypothetical protein
LYRRAAGGKSRVEARQSQQHLSESEEKALVQWISRLTTLGYPAKHSFLREMAEEVRRQRIKHINDDGIERVTYPPIGKNWTDRFLDRHPQLKSTIGRPIDVVRIKDVTKDTLMKWFNDVRKTFDKHNIDLRNVYNMDESGFSIGKIAATRVIIDKRLRSKYQAQPGQQEWVSVVECICADGSSVAPLVIFRGENLSSTWIPARS